MTKRSKKRVVRHERDQLGCMWSFISILDFRHSRPTRRLLSDRRRGSSHAGDEQHSVNEFEVLTNLDEKLEVTPDGEESSTVAADGGKPSVKILMEEEMVGEHDTDIKVKDSKLVSKQSDLGDEDCRRKNRRRRKKSSRGSYDMDNATESLASRCADLDANQDRTNSHNESSTAENICVEICQETIETGKNHNDAEVQIQVNSKHADLKEKLCEAIKELINQKLKSGKHLTEDGGTPFSKELVNALQIPNLNEDSFSKLLEDPDSILVKYLQSSQDAHLRRDTLSESFAESNLSKEKHDKSDESQEVVNHKSYKFFRRNVKSHETKTLGEIENPQTSNRIVILKPGPAESNNSTALDSTDTFLGHSPDVVHKGQGEKASRHFLISEIRKRWKNVMGKEQHGRSPGGVTKRLPDGGKANMGENNGMNSPGKEHFYMEKIARPVAKKREEKTVKPRDSEANKEYENVNESKRRVSNIYIEAKKHLSEMLSTADEVTDFSNGQFPKSLGRILSLPEYNSPLASPGKMLESSLVTAQMRLSAHLRSPRVDENKERQIEEANDSHQGPSAPSTESELCILVSCDDKMQTSDKNLTLLDEPLSSNEVEETSASYLSLKDSEILIAVDDIINEEHVSKVTSTSSASPASLQCGAEDHLAEDIDDDYTDPDHKKEEPHSNDELHASPFASPSSSSTIQKVVDLEIAVDKPERQSPVSVLEPLFMEDDISPARTASRSEPSIQPLKIKFEDEMPHTPKHGIHIKTSMEGKEPLLGYVEAVLHASGLGRQEFYLRSELSDQLIEPSVFDEVDFFYDQLHFDQKLVFDCINEVLLEVCQHYFGCSPWVSFVKPSIKPVRDIRSAIYVVWEGVHWHLLPLSPPSNLEQIVRKDMVKSGKWMDLRFDSESIGFEMGDAIFDELIDEIIDCCMEES
ncbi:uncharacterized protein LOC115678027 isoform X1 [Syzygium oleosum]|uniref:uncharacterized protein LOC115678027 isoform X1 n=1 Tax=Syzygium oleosum TaxID=219896 RepID=UPI0024BB14FB|nr:uncharacterized protein LOC115678027 isoform X1 [Syzygium oleosum]XP_056174241.1 uncharacterized protein LOC115678027 isoform X1 [Syzygium oleosum]XP_056174242.1 uncharacterized protein LOC115678027 isoform X1 [Syzygium oleosum]XP_056174243.1 uncharacterized protein LOC115678027 isoform X1 [Syzygium oleosum]XP_056174244.1 uncharacterized protein LOC115678027 isoform X1 [Syzygium oleosum]